MFVKNKLNKLNKLQGPPGCNPLRDEDRMPVLKVVSGDSWTVDAELVAADGGPASPDNSCVEFVLSENQFASPLWTGEWFSGVFPDEFRKGLVHVKLPQEFTKALRRGSYMFSLRVSDKMKFSFDTQLKGYFLVEYLPTSDQHSIPYRDGTSEKFPSGGQSGPDTEPSPAPEPGNDVLIPDDQGKWHKIIAVRDSETGEYNIGLFQDGKKL